MGCVTFALRVTSVRVAVHGARRSDAMPSDWGAKSAMLQIWFTLMDWICQMRPRLILLAYRAEFASVGTAINVQFRL